MQRRERLLGDVAGHLALGGQLGRCHADDVGRDVDVVGLRALELFEKARGPVTPSSSA